MRYVFFCFVLFFTPHYFLCAQKAKYSIATLGEQVRIVGTVGNSIHAWSVSKETKNIFKEVNLLTLHIFSPGMDLTDEKKIAFGESVVAKIDFQMADSFYYINIIYNDGINKRLMLRIDADGNMTNVTNVAGLVVKTGLLSGVQYIGSVTANTNNFFAARISTSEADSSIANAILPPQETFNNKQSYETLTFRKVNGNSQQLVAEKAYASAYLNFSRLMISATDSTVYACAFAQPKTGTDKNPYKGSYFFLIRLDTNLNEIVNGPTLLKNKKWPSNEIFSPTDIFPLNKNLLLISTGLNNKTSFSYYRDSRAGISTYIPRAFFSYTPSSVMMTVADEKNNLLTDTTIKIKEGREQLQWGNRFILPASNEVRIFCSHRYTASKAGITLFTIGQDGKINERDLIVYEKYAYSLLQAVSLEQGVLLVPYTYKRKTGLMKLAYETTE